MADNKIRCGWSTSEEIYVHYHDTEWGIPQYNDQKLFELICLEGAQAGLSWLTVLKKRENYRRLFDNFNPEKISKYDEKKFDELMADPGIIRNRLKIKSFIGNARAYLDIVSKNNSFSEYIWQFTDGKPIRNNFKSLSELPAKTGISDVMSKKLKKDGFNFVGSTICYAFMQAAGMVNDHVAGCFRYEEINSKLKH